MAYWSITCHARERLTVPDTNQVLGPGLNVFTVVLDNVDPLLSWLGQKGASVVNAIRLDDPKETEDAGRFLGQSASNDL